MSRAVSVRTRMRRLALTSSALIVAGFALILALLMARNKQYAGLLYNVATASEFNQDFKNNIDQKMYYYVIESQYSEGLPIGEVEAAQDLARSLLATTSQKDSLLAITSVLNLCQNLEEKIYQIQDTPNYDSRQNQLENNIYVLTSLIQEYMYNYLYYESVQLNVLQRQIDRQIAAEILLVAVLSAALIAALCWYSVRVSRSVAVPIVELCQRAEDVAGGDLTVKEPVRSHTYEIRTLSESMEQMIVRLNAQIEQTTQKQASLRRAELALLQAQINPHFLYNALDSIRWKAEKVGAEDIAQMTTSLATLFRTSLSRGREIIPIEQEAKHVLSYLQIQKQRYGDKLTYSMDLPPEAFQLYTVKLVLQPLVENAIYHGIKESDGPGDISITIQVQEDTVTMRVTDNGLGIPADRLEVLQAGLARGISVNFDGYGIFNVNERLRLHFGREYGLQLESEWGRGTAATLTMPRITAEEVNRYVSDTDC